MIQDGMKHLFGGWGDFSKRIAQWEADDQPESEPLRLCTCPLPDSDWSFGGWHHCIDKAGNQCVYEHCPEFYIHHRKKLGDGDALRFDVKPGDPHKLLPYRVFNQESKEASVIE